MHNGKGKCCVLVNCTYHLFPSCSTRATEEFSGKKENRPFAEKNYKTERARGEGRRTSEEMTKGKPMAACRF